MTTEQARQIKYARLSIIATAIGIVVTAAIGLWQHYAKEKVKALEVSLESKLALVEVREDVKKAIRITYNNQIVSDLSRARFKLTNVGNSTVISKDDVLQPLSLSFGADVNVIKVDLTAFPDTIGAKAVPSGALVTITFDALEPDDVLYLDVLFTGRMKGLPQARGRILGLKNKAVEISDRSRAQPLSSVPTAPLWQILVFTGIGAVVGYGSFSQRRVGFLYWSGIWKWVLMDLAAHLMFAEWFVLFVLEPGNLGVAFFCGFASPAFFAAILTRVLAKELQTPIASTNC
jgi:hypothetical protein